MNKRPVHEPAYHTLARKFARLTRGMTMGDVQAAVATMLAGNLVEYDREYNTRSIDRFREDFSRLLADAYEDFDRLMPPNPNHPAGHA